MRGSLRCYSELKLKELTVDDFWLITDADANFGDWRGTLELGAEDNNGLSQQACTALAEE